MAKTLELFIHAAHPSTPKKIYLHIYTIYIYTQYKLYHKIHFCNLQFDLEAVQDRKNNG